MVTITITLTQADKDLIKDEAKSKNLSISSYIRYNILQLIKTEDLYTR